MRIFVYIYKKSAFWTPSFETLLLKETELCKCLILLDDFQYESKENKKCVNYTKLKWSTNNKILFMNTQHFMNI